MKIFLDGIDLATVPGPVVRERLNCLTQDPFLFSASVRSNLDPAKEASDEDITSALHKVGLWSVLEAKLANRNATGRGVGEVLDVLMDAELLSHGQRQLFCLARALLKPGKVLILDKPTSRYVVNHV